MGAQQVKDLTLNEILTIEDCKIQSVPIEEWAGNVYVKIMDAEERSEIEEFFMNVKDKKRGVGQFRKEIIKRCWVNKDGSRFLPDEVTANAMMKKNSNAIETIFESACELNGFRSKDVDTLKKK